MMGEPGEGNVKGYDPGWNDPPMFSYDSRPTPAPGKKPSLTKRVGLSWDSSVHAPLPSGVSSDEPILPASAPPRGPVVGPPPIGAPAISCQANPPSADIVLPSGAGSTTVSPRPLPSAPPFEEEAVSQSLGPNTGSDEPSSRLDLLSVSSALKEVAEQLFVDKERERSEIDKRLSLLESLWREGKFPEAVKEKLLGISIALKNSNPDEADNLQRSLMVDHSAVCSSWMAAVRKMISTSRQTPPSSS